MHLTCAFRLKITATKISCLTKKTRTRSCSPVGLRNNYTYMYLCNTKSMFKISIVMCTHVINCGNFKPMGQVKIVLVRNTKYICSVLFTQQKMGLNLCKIKIAQILSQRFIHDLVLFCFRQEKMTQY